MLHHAPRGFKIVNADMRNFRESVVVFAAPDQRNLLAEIPGGIRRQRVQLDQANGLHAPEHRQKSLDIHLVDLLGVDQHVVALRRGGVLRPADDPAVKALFSVGTFRTIRQFCGGYCLRRRSYFSAAAASSTRLKVDALTLLSPFRTRDTVAAETFASFATS